MKIDDNHKTSGTTYIVKDLVEGIEAREEAHFVLTRILVGNAWVTILRTHNRMILWIELKGYNITDIRGD